MKQHLGLIQLLDSRYRYVINCAILIFVLKSARLTYDVPGIAKSLIIPISAPAVVTRSLSNLTIEKIEFAGNFLNSISLLQILKQS